MVKIPDQYKSKEEYVHALFSSIAHRYDLLNTLLSFNRDRYWRYFAVKQTGLRPGGKGLDVCCGTGKLAIEQAKVVGPAGKVVGLDFCENMLEVGKKNVARTPYRDIIEFVQGNAIDLPFPDNTFDCATIGFALRNVPDIEKTISEMMRVVRPGGKVVSLELAKPSLPVFKQLYYFYFNRLVPFLGRLGVGLEGPYSYLPNSLKSFPHQEEIRQLFAGVGLEDARYYELTGGIVAVHVGTKPEH
ncbi:demethylmenaquinone methyltransferase [Calderihabitans maritimus]|uniref:Demethylmenaquinone methyltransferase n=1 Tax=Calderihabitans maritimus TaxID=1246530 RepID=A0A1Z5HR97_9FIRM|nr:demethylmenaquinone methyltransferase [Calderihabitans maritimus]GAW91887.1 ubiquinone/menaquinone biosynthesis methyltransferase ubiE [Calderihabitans maritimus]